MDSSDFRDNREEEEEEYNEMLDSLADEENGVHVRCLENKFEDVVRAAAGEKNYQQLAQKYPGLSKPTRQRLIAADAEMPIPAQFEEILTWLAPPPETKAK